MKVLVKYGTGMLMRRLPVVVLCSAFNLLVIITAIWTMQCPWRWFSKLELDTWGYLLSAWSALLLLLTHVYLLVAWNKNPPVEWPLAGLAVHINQLPGARPPNTEQTAAFELDPESSNFAFTWCVSLNHKNSGYCTLEPILKQC